MRGSSYRRPPMSSRQASSHRLLLMTLIILITLAQPSSSSSSTTTTQTDTSSSSSSSYYDGYINTSPENPNPLSIIYNANDKRITSSYVKTRGRDHVVKVFSTDGNKCLVDVSDDETMIVTIASIVDDKIGSDYDDDVDPLQEFDVVIHLAEDVGRSDLFEVNRDEDSEYDGSLNLCLVVSLLPGESSHHGKDKKSGSSGSSNSAPPPPPPQLKLITRFNLILNEATVESIPVEYIGETSSSSSSAFPVSHKTPFDASRVIDGDLVNLRTIVNVTKDSHVTSLKARALTIKDEKKLSKKLITLTISSNTGDDDDAMAYDVTGRLNLTMACANNDIYKSNNDDNNNNEREQGGTLSFIIQIEIMKDDEQRHRTKKKESSVVSVGYINAHLTLQTTMTTGGGTSSSSYRVVKIINEIDKISSSSSSSSTPPMDAIRKITTPIILDDYPIIACQCNELAICQRSFLSRTNNVVRICLELISNDDVVIDKVDYMKLSQFNWQQGRTPINYGGRVADSSTTVVDINNNKEGSSSSVATMITTRAVERFFENRDPIPIGVAGSVIFRFDDGKNDDEQHRRRERDRRRDRRELVRNRYNQDHQMSKNVFTVIIPVERDDNTDGRTDSTTTGIDDASSSSSSSSSSFGSSSNGSASHFSDVVILAAKVVFGLATSGLILLAFATMMNNKNKTTTKNKIKDDIKCEEYLC